ncbi:hypothetical protein ACIRQF_00050 [Streptomyces sp. NPDC101191]|uniref:hypothetical protein n=1 Tax=Streptomyces sp. NPDC101191 TaxID=3366126 RepID=UPI003803A184
MTNEAAVWHRLAALLPPDDTQAVVDYWSIGEQEGGLELLVSALLRHQVPIDETTRAEIAVVCEAWGMWPHTLAPRLSQCPGSETASVLQLIENTTSAPMPATTASLGDQLVLVPWISCTTCGQTLARTHTLEPWGMSLTPEHYVILDTGQGTIRHLFTQGKGWEALTALRNSCEKPELAQP